MLALLVAPVLVAGACGDPADDGASPARRDCDGPTWGADAGRRDGAPTITAPCGKEPSELVVTDLKEGSGAELTDGMVATVDYTGAVWKDGSVFDASYGGSPFTVKVGAGRVIPGWDQGLVGMKVGGRRQLVIPADLAYGEQGSPPAIPANATLVFIIDLRSAETPAEAPPAPAGVEGGKVDSLVVTDEIAGSGDAVESGDQVRVQYIGVHGATGEVFDSSWQRGEPFEFTVGQGEVIAGWDQGLIGMQVGGRRRLEIPGSLAYGPSGRPPTIGPDETLVFSVDLVGIG